MAYNNHNGGHSYGGNNNGNRSFQNAGVPQPLTAMSLPPDYVDKAENIMRKLIVEWNSRLTTSKLRNILSMVSDIYNREVGRVSESELTEENQTALQMLRVRIAYEVKRDEDVGTFSKEAHLIEYIKGLGRDRKKFLAFAHYMEALVAYHRFYGGSEK